MNQKTQKKKKNECYTPSYVRILTTMLVVYFILTLSYTYVWSLPSWINDPLASKLSINFVSAIKELSDSIPEFTKIPLSKNPLTKYSLERIQRNTIEKLRILGTKISKEEILDSVIEIKKHVETILSETEQAEDSFKNAVSEIESVTSSLLRDIPILNDIIQDGNICKAINQFNDTIIKISLLIDVLEDSIKPVSSIKINVIRLVDEVNILNTNLGSIMNDVSSKLMVQQLQKEEYDSARFYQITKEDIDKEKYRKYSIAQITIGEMKSITSILDTSFSRAEIQIKICVDHLKVMKKKLFNIYKSLLITSNEIQEHYQNIYKDKTLEDMCLFGMRVKFDYYQISELSIATKDTIKNIRSIKNQNSDILHAIQLNGFSALSTTD